MNFEPILGLGYLLFAVQRHYLDLFVAGAIVVGTMAYMTRIAGISMFYGVGAREHFHQDPPASGK